MTKPRVTWSFYAAGAVMGVCLVLAVWPATALRYTSRPLSRSETGELFGGAECVGHRCPECWAVGVRFCSDWGNEECPDDPPEQGGQPPPPWAPMACDGVPFPDVYDDHFLASAPDGALVRWMCKNGGPFENNCWGEKKEWECAKNACRACLCRWSAAQQKYECKCWKRFDLELEYQKADCWTRQENQ